MLAKAMQNGRGILGRGAARPGRWGRQWKPGAPCRQDDCPAHGGRSVVGLAPGQGGIIKEVPDHPLLPALGLRPGKRVELVSAQPFGGPVVAEVDGRCVALARCLANQIVLNGFDGAE